MAHILAVDDDAALRALLAQALARDGHDVLTASCGAEATAERCAWADLILLDVMLPGEDGFALCKRLRQATGCPILFLTARTGEADVIAGLGFGADDYIVKPFRVAELRARVRAHLRREQRPPTRRLARGALAFDLAARALYCGNVAVPLTRGEYDICATLARHPGQAYSKEQLYEAAFGFDGDADDSAITEHVKNIRAKLRPLGQNPIETVWGVGYRWETPKDARD